MKVLSTLTLASWFQAVRRRRWRRFLVVGYVFVGAHFLPSMTYSAESQPTAKELVVVATDDFEVTGSGQAEAWQKATWAPLTLYANKESKYETRVKVLYSKTGLYALMEASDAVITSTFREDYSAFWLEDVFEVFLWTDEAHPIYFEYEISPLGYELPILVPNLDGKFMGWLPWNFKGSRKTRKATAAIGGELASGAKVRGWTAEVFIPFELLKPMQNVPPQPGTRWRANFYRVDRDQEILTTFEWAVVNDEFHDFKKFGVLVFQ